MARICTWLPVIETFILWRQAIVDFEKAREVLELTDARIKTIWLYRRSDKPRNSKG